MENYTGLEKVCQMQQTVNCTNTEHPHMLSSTAMNYEFKLGDDSFNLFAEL